MQTVTLAERPDLLDEQYRPDLNAVPAMVDHDPVAAELWEPMVELFPEYQVLVLDDDGQVVAKGNSIPLHWEGADADLPEEGFDWALAAGMADREAGRAATVASALLIGVAADRQGEGLSSAAARALRDNAAARGLSALLAPLRPTLKDRYPLIPMAEYAAWTRPDGGPFDPWLRVHRRLGARLLHPCERSMEVTGSVAEWEEWTGMAFPGTGSYTVPGALAPVEIDRAADTGRYTEPNVWAVHPC
ncbi:hypothetical protein [Nocardiopsis composta]|uniref:GNAT superfamily N-acetyltransferase n=1 Tax=Nocardiopsis composta TaxID=157465 RepID=A0A7W8QJV4_9ACTN|nr:hypothetical protein [Nocardiopsis composta]MBB5430836.1 GNAT superfamily N-acetyltransferase [Nocardiopsis composta]